MQESREGKAKVFDHYDDDLFHDQTSGRAISALDAAH
jgi:hypothetical protein